jgi:hypothetical protein
MNESISYHRKTEMCWYMYSNSNFQTSRLWVNIARVKKTPFFFTIHGKSKNLNKIPRITKISSYLN